MRKALPWVLAALGAAVVGLVVALLVALLVWAALVAAIAFAIVLVVSRRWTVASKAGAAVFGGIVVLGVVVPLIR